MTDQVLETLYSVSEVQQPHLMDNDMLLALFSTVSVCS